MRYDFTAIEARWQERWEKDRTFHQPNPGEPGFDRKKPKYYILDMFPYPSGVGLHVGHPLGYIATDIVARYKRMRGFNVLHPMGFDSFGLPAEQFAVEHGVHPRVTTQKNIANMLRQLKALGLSYDWDRELATTEPGFYRWTQWIFLQLYESWFDPDQNKARPIGELEAALARAERALDGECRLVAPGTADARRWSDLDLAARRDALDHHRLAYMAEVSVNWCPQLGTVLANEEVTAEGRSERGNFPVFKRPLEQWMLRITAYAERLVTDLAEVDWPESVASMQRNWIGRSEGADVEFAIDGHRGSVPIFTTRPDTLFGATYMVLAPENPLVDEIVTEAQRAAVTTYRTQAEAKTELQRQTEAAEGDKTGVFTGAHAINPVNGERIQIWVADYVLMTYGTGAIMAVPASDQRDFEFAKAFALPIRPVVYDPAWLLDQAVTAGWLDRPADGARAAADDAVMGPLRARYDREAASLGAAMTAAGRAINSTAGEISLDGLETDTAKQRICAWLETKGIGTRSVQYKLRDWLFSRQRYWGEPFPILHGPDGEIRPVAKGELPVELPEMENFRPESSDDPDAPPSPPLERAPESWRVVERDGVRWQRELNTMPNWAGSCWYYLRFLDPSNSDAFVGSEAERYWMRSSADGRGGVDLYVGGVEHAVLHLLYARFWHKVLFDLGHVSTPEPFGRLFNQGYILAPSYKDERGMYVPADEVEERDGTWFHDGRAVSREIGKIGKSLKNSISPDEVCQQYGSDTMRLYEMYLGPLARSKIWSTSDIMGVHRFLQRLWRNFRDPETGQVRVDDAPPPDALRRALHRTVAAVTHDMEAMEFNTAIARLIELNNALVKLDRLPREVAEPLVKMIAPLAPHVAEELWQSLGHEQTIAFAPWPEHDPALLVAETIVYPIQVNGKVRAKVQIAADADDAAIEQAALADERVQRAIGDKTVRRVIVVKGRLANIVAK